MSWTNMRRALITCCAAAILLAAPSRSRAECALCDWLFGHGQTTYAPPYSPPNVCAPTAGACGCAPAQPVCQPCQPCAVQALHFLPAGAHRGLHAGRRHRYMQRLRGDDVSADTGLDLSGLAAAGCHLPGRLRPDCLARRPLRQLRRLRPCSGYSSSCGGCASCGTSYSGCSPCGAACGGCSSCGPTYAGCSSCNAGVSSGYVTSGGCSSCNAGVSSGYVTSGGCSSCNTGVSSGYVTSGGCSSCNTGVSGGNVTSGGCASCASNPPPLAGTPLPGPSDMSQPPATFASPGPTTVGPPTAATMPGSSSEVPRPYDPSTNRAPSSPSGPPRGTWPSGTSYRIPTTGEGSRNTDPLRIQIQNIPPVNNGPQLSPTPNVRPQNEDPTTFNERGNNENRTASRPVLQATYFQLLQSPPASVPAQMISVPVQ